MACDVTSSFQMGVPATTNDKGAVDSYLCANLNYKPIATGPTGPTEIKVDNSKVQILFGDGNPDRLRLQFYNPWGGGDAGCRSTHEGEVEKEPDAEDTVQSAEWNHLERGRDS